MIATHRVKDSSNNTVGFLIENNLFISIDYIVNNKGIIDNLKIQSNGIVRADKKLPIIELKSVMDREYNKIKSDNPIIRDIQSELEYWRDNRFKTVAQVDGPRQTGKTTEIKKFAYKNYEYVIYVNLASDTYNFKEACSNGIDVMQMIIYTIRARLPRYVNNRKTILIIDEIQLNPMVYNSIRTMKSNLSCDIIVTGSYLGRILASKEFFLPAGTLTKINMSPLSFKEFCRAYESHDILNSISLHGDSDRSLYHKLDNLYEAYRQIGGYPDVVMEYKRTHNISSCYNVIQQLLNIFQDESRVYFDNDKMVMIFNEIYHAIVIEMCREKRGSGNKLVEEVTRIVKDSQKMLISRDEVASAIRWLSYCNIIGTCDLCEDCDTLKIQANRRIYFTDCGIASYLLDKYGIESSNAEGLKSENFVYSELNRLFTVKHSDQKVKLDRPCFVIHGNNELDFFLMDKDNKKYGIEVKTTQGDPTSLKYFISRSKLDFGIVAKMALGGRLDSKSKLYSIPIYTVGSRFPYK